MIFALFPPDFLHALLTETVFTEDVRPGVSRVLCTWYKTLGTLPTCSNNSTLPCSHNEQSYQRLCRRAMKVLGTFENVSWISYQDYGLLLILQRALLHPKQNRRAVPVVVVITNPAQAGAVSEDLQNIASGVLPLPKQCPSRHLAVYRFGTTSDDWK